MREPTKWERFCDWLEMVWYCKITRKHLWVECKPAWCWYCDKDYGIHPKKEAVKDKNE